MTKQLKIFLGVAAVLLIGASIAGYFSIQNKAVYPETKSPRPFAGKADSSVVVQEFSDFQCPACKSAQNTLKQVISKYGDRVRFEYKHFPLSSIHPRAKAAAEAAECANDQGKFWEYHDILFANQPNFRDSQLTSYAEKLELDMTSFSACVDSRAKKDIVQDDYNEGIKKNIQGTPTFFVNGKQLENWNSLDQEIEAALAN